MISSLKSLIKIIKVPGKKNSKESFTAPTDTRAGHLHRFSTAVFFSPLVTFVLHMHTPSSSRTSHRRQSQERENVLLLWTPSAGAWQSQGLLQEQEISTCSDTVREHGSTRRGSSSRGSVPLSLGTQRTGSCRQPSRQSCCRQWLRGGSGALSPRAMPSQSCACAERPRAPVPGSGAPSGAPGSCRGVLPKPCAAPARAALPQSSAQSWERWANEPGTHLGFCTRWTLLLFSTPRLFLSCLFSSLAGIPSPLPTPLFSFFFFSVHVPGGSLQTFPSHSGIR